MKKVFLNIGELLSLQAVAEKDGRKVLEEDLGILSKSAFVVDEKGLLLWLGPRNKIPKEFAKKSKEIDLKGQCVLPGFVECHTHSLFAGDRCKEFELRNQGVSYQEINARGGGIRSTMSATRKASSSDLRKLLEKRIDQFVRQGVTTLEVKTGYALDLKHELRCLKVLAEKFKIPVVSTYLGAHSLPPEFVSSQDYLQFIQDQVLPRIQKLTRRVDIFIERGFFDFDPALDYLTRAQEMGFDIAIHADQLSLCGGTDAALALAAKSADHLLQIDAESIAGLARSQVTCVLLPAADLYMKCSYPKARELIDAGARVALATDFNPGSSPTQDLSLVGVLARLEMKMTLPEVLAAYTYGAACALGLQSSRGSLVVGRRADFVVRDQSWDQSFYSVGDLAVQGCFSLGREL